VSDAVLAALIGGGAAVVVAVIAAVPALITARRVGSPNGQGSLTNMVGKVLAWSIHNDKRMDQLEVSHTRLEAKVDRYHAEDQEPQPTGI
jgi:hypothetical protein